MTRRSFEQLHEASWKRLESLIDAIDAQNRGIRPVALRLHEALDTAEFDRLYRGLCKQLALAQQRMYGTDLLDRLNELALRAHQQLYSPSWSGPAQLLRFLGGGFPALVRARYRTVLLAAALLLLPALAMGWASLHDPDLIYAIHSPEEIRQFEEMYDPSQHYRPQERQSDGDLMMFGFYLWNNISVAFRTFAGGIAFGAGSVFFLVLNGLSAGAIAGHLDRVGLGDRFYTFVVGHAGPELTALVLSGAAGLNLAGALLAPGRRPRIDALRGAAEESVRLVGGAALFLVSAAFIEAYWSSSDDVADGVKVTVGAGLALSTLAYLLLVGRRHGP